MDMETVDSSRNSNSNSNPITVYPLVRLNDVKLAEVPPPSEIKSTGSRKRKQSFASLTLTAGQMTLKNKPDPFDIAFCTDKPEFVGSVILFVDLEGCYFSNSLGICSVCKRPNYTLQVHDKNLIHGTFICSPCSDVVNNLLGEIECQLKYFICLNNDGECYKYKNTKNHLDSASYGSLPLCESCTAINVLNSFDLDDTTTFKIWRSIHPIFQFDFKEVSLRRSSMFPNRGKIIVLNENGGIVSANIVRTADDVNRLKALNGEENRPTKKVKVLKPNETLNYDKLKGARVKQVTYNSGIAPRLPIATFESITGIYPLVPKIFNSSHTSPKIKEEEPPISNLNTLINDINGISNSKTDDVEMMNNEKFFIKRQEGLIVEKIKTLLPSTFSFENDGNPIITIKGSMMPPSPSCFHCSSKGLNQLLFCSICVEPYHPFCIEDKQVLSDFRNLKEKLKSQSFEKDREKFIVPINPGMYNQEIIDLYNQFIGWKCRKCSLCDICKMNFKKEFNELENEIIKCKKCNESSQHIGCILRNTLVNSKSFKLDSWTSNWNCPNCLSCKSCGCNLNFQQQQNKNSFNQLLCQLCAKRRRNGHFCPVCQCSYDETDYETPMVECTKCNKWIHAACEAMTNDDYSILGILPEEIEFECRICKKLDPPIWRKGIIKEYLNGIKIIMNTFKAEFLNKISGSTNGNCISSDQTNNTASASAQLFAFKIEEHQENNIIPKGAKVNNELISKYNIVESKVVLVDFMHKSSGLRKNELTDIYDTLNNLHDKTLNMAKNQQSKSVMCVYKFVVLNLYKNNKITSYLEMDICLEILKSSIKEALSWFKIENLPKYNGNGTFLEELTTNKNQNQHILQQQIQKREIDPMFDLKPVVESRSVFPNVNPFAEIYWNPDYFIDKRACGFCEKYGDYPESLAGRLLHFGYDNWVHINCALWSSEVWEDPNGRLQQVGPALKRCYTLICDLCRSKGASVNCCQNNCKTTYHFMCSLEAKCQMLENKEVYCPKHTQLKTKMALIQQDFEVMRNITIDFDSIRKYEVAISSSDLVVFIGSLCIANLGEIVPISVTQPRLRSKVLKGEDKSETILVPLHFKSMRIFRSAQNQKNLNGMTRYYFNTKFKRPENSQLIREINKNINILVDHSSKDLKSNREQIDRINKFALWIENSPRHIDEYKSEHFAFPFIEQSEWINFLKENLKKNKIFQLQNKINEYNLHQNQSNFNFNIMKINGYLNGIVKKETTVIENLTLTPSYEKENMSQLKRQLSPIKSIMRYSKNGQINNQLLTKTEIIYEILCNDEIIHQSTNVESCWNDFLIRVAKNHPSLNRYSSFFKAGISRDSIQYLFEQLPKASELAWGHKFKFQNPPNVEREYTFKGSSRTEMYTGRKPYDMFGWLASRHRDPIPANSLSVEDSRMKTQNLPMAMRYRLLKKSQVASKNYIVCCSKIQGRGLYTKVNISQGDLIIEYSGEIIRSSVCDKREKYYESRGIGCYFFRIDEFDVIDATLKGSGARFINHSCEPNCESKILKISGKKRIIIFALIDIAKGEELTYDYKFCKEAADKKIPCNCSSKKCRKFLN